jgi:hypothetical protein
MNTYLHSLDLHQPEQVMAYVLSEKMLYGSPWSFWNMGERRSNGYMYIWSSESPSKGVSHVELPHNWIFA